MNASNSLPHLVVEKIREICSVDDYDVAEHLLRVTLPEGLHPERHYEPEEMERIQMRILESSKGNIEKIKTSIRIAHKFSSPYLIKA